MIKVIIVI